MKRSKKESFILYLDSRNLLDCLDYEKKGRLFEAIFTYVAGDKVPSLSPEVNMAFISIKTYLDKDREKYYRICEKRREYGKLGGLAKGSISNHMQASEADTDTDNDNDNDTDTDNDTDNDNDNDNESGEYIYINQPTGPEDVVAYIKGEWNWDSKSAKDWGERFFYHYDAQGWVLGNGRPIQDWRSALYNFVDGKRNIKLYGE